MLAYNWQEYDEQGIKHGARDNDHFSGICRAQADRKVLSKLPIAPHQCPGFTQFATVREAVPGVFADPIFSAHDEAEFGAVEFAGLDEALGTIYTLVKHRFQSLQGHVPRGPAFVSVPLASAKILGPKSKAGQFSLGSLLLLLLWNEADATNTLTADTLLAHCFVNRHYSLSQELMRMGTRFTLDHFKIILKVSAK